MMVEALDADQARTWRERGTPEVERLAGGIWSVPVPIPNNPLRYTLSYLVSGTRGIIVIDPGWDTDAGWTALNDGLASAGAGLADLVGVVVTHVHADHHGLSGRVREASGAWIAMHPAERDTLPARSQRPRRGLRRMVKAWLRSHGAPEEELDRLARMPATNQAQRYELAEPDVLLEDGDLVPLSGRSLRAVWTPGHTPGHLCLVDTSAGALLTGDHLLPQISPHIGVQPGVHEPLGPYLRSLDKVAEFDAFAAYPAHEYRFRGIGARVAELLRHHEERCAELLVIVADLGKATTWQIAERLTWSKPWPRIGAMRVAAVAETAAHVQYLVERGFLERHDAEVGFFTLP
jgi:glyoxylase-like metal-dependent hydrolase (beta-lactamase superfamily II)